MFEDYPTKAEAEEEAQEYATPLDQLIGHSDVAEGTSSWEEVPNKFIRDEAYKSAQIIATEHDEMRNLIKDRAFRIWTDGFRRVSRDVLGDASDTELIHVFNIWPNDLRRDEMYSIAHKVFEDPNFRIPNDCYDEAREEVITGLIEGTKPDL
jgi:hypothetical protein